MNLHQIVRGAITTVNPDLLGTVRVSTGYTTAADGKRTPTYDDLTNIPMQIQALSAKEIEHLDSLNIGPVSQAIYMTGNFESLDRADNKGGDVILVGGRTLLIVQVIERWIDWCKVAVVRQKP